jgi:hypothetical protein
MRPFTLGLFLISLTIFSSACASSGDANREAVAQPSATPGLEQPGVAVTPAATPAPENATPTPTPVPPQESEIREAVARAYQGAVVFDPKNGQTVVGDFNGDGSEDIAVAVRPAAGKLEEINSEMANWILEDPRQVAAPDPRKFDPHQGVQTLEPPKERPRVAANDHLLAVIHGYKEQGWRNPDARQTYLLKNGVGVEMKSEGRLAARAEAQAKTPRLLGDVIRERLGDEQGFLYWTGARYGWFH